MGGGKGLAGGESCPVASLLEEVSGRAEAATLPTSPCRVTSEMSATGKVIQCHVQLPHWECLAGMEQACTSCVLTH